MSKYRLMFGNGKNDINKALDMYVDVSKEINSMRKKYMVMAEDEKNYSLDERHCAIVVDNALRKAVTDILCTMVQENGVGAFQEVADDGR